MNNLIPARVQNAASTAKLRMRDAFKNESGAFDLPSIIVGVVVVGILTAGVLAAIFGVIPFAQDKAAEQDLGAVTTAQGVAQAQYDGYASLAELQADPMNLLSDGLLPAEVDTKAVDGGWAAASLSGSGEVFVATSENPTPAPAAGGATTVAAALDAVTTLTAAPVVP